MRVFFNNRIIQNVLSQCNPLQKAESLLRSFVESKEGGREEGKILLERNVQSRVQMNEQNAAIIPVIEPDQSTRIMSHSQL